MPARSGTDSTPQGAAPAVVRACRMLDALAASPSGVLSLSDLSRASGVPKSTTSAICASLELGGLIRKDDLGYSLARRMVELGGSYLERVDAISAFYRVCADSPTFATQTVRLSTAAGIDTLCLARYEGHPAIRLTTNIGDRFPSSASAAGKALLARLDDSEIERLYDGVTLPAMTGRSLRTLPRLLKDVRRARALGYAFDDEEAADNVVGLAVVLPRASAQDPVLALSVTRLKSTFTDTERDRMVAELDRVAGELGQPGRPLIPSRPANGVQQPEPPTGR